MNDFTPDQRTAIETLDCNLLVKAGAGAGKTRVLVERYIHILEQGAADTDGIVAITFTRKAAREMKERIRAKVHELMAATEGSDAWSQWREVARKLDAVNISTIHSLCSRILREYPAEAGVDPDFGIMEELDETSLMDEIWQKTLEQAAQNEAQWLNRLLEFYSPAQVRRDFRPLFDAALVEGIIGPDLEKELWPTAADGEEKSRQRLRQAYQELFELIPATGKMSASMERLHTVRDQWPEIELQIESSPENPFILDELEEPFKGMRGGNDLRDALQARRSAAEALRGALLDKIVQGLVPELCEWFRLAEQEWRQAKRACRKLTYDDLENETEKLLLEHPEICARYNRRIRFLMVDECQDINDRQRKIIYLLAGGQATELRRQTLFAVGDCKQSIYRFRGADARVFSRVQADICCSGGRVIELLDNFRSHRQLVTAFNDFFAELMPAPVCEEEVEGADTVEYRKLQGDRGEEGQSRVDLWVLDSDELAGADARDREATMIARRIRALMEEPGQRLQYKDIAVLLRAFTRVESYETAFANAGIPYYVAGSRGLSDRQEIADVLGLLRFLCNPANEAALFGTLRSPFFQLSDDTLLRLRRGGGAGGLWSGLRQAAGIEGLDEAEAAVALHARKLLERMLARRGFLTPEQMIREAFDATGFDALQLTQFMGVRRYANLMKLLDMAQTFMKAEAGELADFLAYMERRAESEGEAEIDSEAGDTVRILTIHKSKGLEFPVVIVPDLQRKFNSRTRMTVFVRGLGLGLKVPDSRGKFAESGRFRKVARQDNAMERAELKRILYVAMTRAERQIILSAVANHPKTAKNLRNASGWLDWARHLFGLAGSPQEWPAEKCIGETCLHICLDDAKDGGEITSPPERKLPDVTPGLCLAPELQRNIAPIPLGPAWSKVLSPAFLADFLACRRRYYYAHVCRMPLAAGISRQSFFRTGTAVEPDVPPQQLGIAFHKFLELLPNRESWQETLVSALRETLPQGLREPAERIMQDWAARYAASDRYEELCSVEGDRREWSFQYRLLPPQESLPAVWLSGQTDRVLFYPDGTLGIIDYKTDHVNADSSQKKAARYRLQLAGYALAARAVFGRSVRDARLYFVRTGETASVEVNADSLAAAAKELQAVAGFIRSHSAEGEYACNCSQCSHCPFVSICLRE